MISAALSFIDPTDREIWVQMAMAIKSELGEEGFEVWNAWSMQADNYREPDAKSVWRSVKAYGGIKIGTLYKLARENGYRGEEVRASVVTPMDQQKRREQERLDREREEARQAEAAGIAHGILMASVMQVHPYLDTKGHGNHQTLVCEHITLFPGTKWEDHIRDEIIVPMRDMRTGRLNSVQRIRAEGTKKFLAGGKAKGSVFSMGTPSGETYLCEGYATALSVKAALESLYRRVRVVVCFSAANIAHVAQQMGDYVIADHDSNGVGRKYAERSGLPWWMPPEEGDANDFHVKRGLSALAQELNQLRLSSAQQKTARETLTV